MGKSSGERIENLEGTSHNENASQMIGSRLDIRKLVDRYIGIPLLIAMRALYTARKRYSLREAHKAQVGRILVIYLSGVGDTVMVATCLAAIARHYPLAKISFLSSSQNYEMVKDNPRISECHNLVTTKGIVGFIRTFWGTLRNIRQAKFDVVIDFEQFLRLSAIVCLTSKARVTLGFRTQNQHRHHAFNHTVHFDPSVHTLDNFVRLMREYEIAAGPRQLEPIYVTEINKAIITDLLDQTGISREARIVGIHPGSGGTATSRRWCPLNFAVIADRLITESRATVVFTGGNTEWALIEKIRSKMKNGESAFNLGGAVTLSQLPGLIEHFAAFVSNDTGPLHIAAAMQVPVIGLFGPNTPSRYGPIGNNHRVIYQALECSPCIIAHEGKVPHCRYNLCMQKITPGDVYRSIESVIKTEESNTKR